MKLPITYKDIPSVFKFWCEKSGKYAFVITTNYKLANEIMERETKMKVGITGRYELHDFPTAQELFNEKGSCIWINNIDPF